MKLIDLNFYSIPEPSTTSKKSIIKDKLYQNYQNNKRRYVQKEFEFGIQKHLEVFKTLPWVSYTRLGTNHVIIWLSNPNSQYSSGES